MENNNKPYKKFELFRYYYTAYKLYRLERKNIKYTNLAKKYDEKYKKLNLAFHVGFHSSKDFTKNIIDIDDAQIGKYRLQKLAGIQENIN